MVSTDIRQYLGCRIYAQNNAFSCIFAEAVKTIVLEVGGWGLLCHELAEGWVGESGQLECGQLAT